MTSARVLTLDDGESGLTFAVWFDRWDMDRAQYGYRICALGETLAEGTDLRMGSGDRPSEGRALECLLSFVSAFAGAIEHEQRTGQSSDNADMFPASLREAAAAVGSEQLAMLAESLGVES